MKGKYKYFVLPVAYDLEDQLILDNSNKKTIIQHAITFCDAIRAAGYTPMVYANLNWFANYLNVQTLHSKGYKLWYANWQPKTTDFSSPVQIGKTGVYADIWQYAEGDMAAGVPDYNVLWDFKALAHVYSGKVIAALVQLKIAQGEQLAGVEDRGARFAASAGKRLNAPLRRAEEGQHSVVVPVIGVAEDNRGVFGLFHEKCLLRSNLYYSIVLMI